MVRLEQNGITWIDMTNPAKEKIEELEKFFKLPPLVRQELPIPTFRPKVVAYGELIYFVIHFPLYHEGQKLTQVQEIDLIVTPKILITTHYQEILPLKELQKELSQNEILRKKIMRANTVRLLHHMVLNLFSFALRELTHIEQKISVIEKHIFAQKQKEIVYLISLVRSDMINFSRAIKPLDPIFKELGVEGKTLFGNRWNGYFANMAGEYRKTMNMVEVLSQTVASLQTTNDSLLSSHINQFLKILAVINLLVMPLVVVESIIGIRWYIQEIRGSLAMIEVGLVLLIALLFDILFIVLFRYKKWL